MSSSSTKAQLAAQLYRLRWPLAVIVLTTCLLVAGFGGLRVTSLTEEVKTLGSAADTRPLKLFDPRYEIWFGAKEETLAAYRKIEAEFGARELIVIAFEVADPTETILSDKPLTTIRRLTQELQTIPGVTHVKSLSNVLPTTEVNHLAVLLDSRMASGAPPLDRFLSPDGRATALYVAIDRYQIARREDGTELARALYAVDAQRASLNGIEAALTAETTRSGYRFHVAGFPVSEREFERIGLADSLLQGLVFLVFAVVLRLVFRRWALVFIVLATVTISIITMVGIMWLLDDLFNNLTIIAPLMLTVVAIAGVIHLISTYCKLKDRFDSRRALVTEVIRQNLLSVFLTSVTTAVGFFALTTSGLQPLRTLGYLVGLGTLMAYALSMTLVPAALSLLPLDARTKPVNLLPGALALTRWIKKHRFAIMAVVGLLSGLTALGLFRVDLETDTRSFLPKHNQVIKDIAWIDEHLSGFGSFEILIAVPKTGPSDDLLQQVAAFEDRLRAASRTPGDALHILTGVTSPVPALKAGRKTELSTESILRVLAHVRLASSEEHLLAVDRIEQIAKTALSSGPEQENVDSFGRWPDFSLTGKFLIYAELFRNLKLDYIKSMLLALCAITIIIGLTFRSVTVALISAVPNALPVLVPMAVFGLVGRPLDGPAIIVSSIALGVCVDDTIHFLLRYHEERNRGSTAQEAIKATFEGVGRALIITTGVLALGFSVLCFAQFSPNVAIGSLAVVMFVLALLADFFVTPALLFLTRTGASVSRRKHEGPVETGRWPERKRCVP